MNKIYQIGEMFFSSRTNAMIYQAFSEREPLEAVYLDINKSFAQFLQDYDLYRHSGFSVKRATLQAATINYIA